MEENYKGLETDAVPQIPENRHEFNDNEKDLMTQACTYIYSMSKWMKFFFVLMIILIVFMFFFGLFFMLGGSFVNSYASSEIPNIPFWLFGLIYLVCAGVFVLPAIYMRRIYTAADLALICNDNAAMVEFLKNNKSLWKFFGIFTIVMFCLSITVFPLIGALVGLANL